MIRARRLWLAVGLMAAAASAEQTKPLPDADVQARCDAEGGCVLVTNAWLNQQALRVRAALEAAAASCRRADA